MKNSKLSKLQFHTCFQSPTERNRHKFQKNQRRLRICIIFLSRQAILCHIENNFNPSKRSATFELCTDRYRPFCLVEKFCAVPHVFSNFNFQTDTNTILHPYVRDCMKLSSFFRYIFPRYAVQGLGTDFIMIWQVAGGLREGEY